MRKQEHFHDLRGVGFDQHYTDSAIKLLAPKSYRAFDKFMQTKRAVPKQDILSSLLLFDKAYLSHPSWLPGAESFPELERFENEDLIEWIPNDCYESAFDVLGLLVKKLYERASWESRPDRLVRPVRGDYEKYQSKRDSVESELSRDILVLIEECLYVLPLIRANLNHLNLKTVDPLAPLLYPITNRMPWLLPEELFKGGEAFELFEGYAQGSFSWHLHGSSDIFEDFPEMQYVLAGVFDGLLSSLAAERFGAVTSLPIKTSGDAKPSQMKTRMLGSEAYQLVRIQFHDIRYPIIESVDDVLRLREDPSLRSYRSVVAEYSERLRQEMESERPRVLQEFRHDIQAALRSLSVVRRWSRIVDFSFYISLPLAILGVLYGLPFSDILAIPLTSYAKVVTHQKRKELDWILFGRPRSG